MNKKNINNKEMHNPISGIVEEIEAQDLDDKIIGGGASTAVQLTLAGKCGSVFTVSYECTSNRGSCISN